MKNAVFTIFKKECKRFFSDRRMVLTTILLPGLMIFAMYNFMGSAMTDLFGAEEENYTLAAVNMPVSAAVLFEQAGIETENRQETELDDVKEDIADSMNYQACIVFPKDFEQAVASYDVMSGESAPQVSVFYNSSDTQSSMAYQTAVALLDAYESSMANKFDINMGQDIYDLAGEEELTGMFFSMLMPMLLLIFLYSGCMAVGVESIAGEKERGTIATLLVTPVKRRDIAVGKILALSLFALLSGASSALGTLTSLPKLVGGMGDEAMVSGSFYTAKDYAMLAIVILSTVLVLITLISVISAFAKTVKEAQTYVMPVMIVVMVIGISGMFGGAPDNAAFYLIPLYNSVQSMVSIFSFTIHYGHLLITVIANLVFALLGVFVLTKLFRSEKVMFSR